MDYTIVRRNVVGVTIQYHWGEWINNAETQLYLKTERKYNNRIPHDFHETLV
jgi:hypothetical protein